MTTVPDSSTGSGPEVLAAGPARLPGRPLRIALIVVVAVGLVIGATVVGLRIYRARTDTVSLAELKTTYAAFLAPDGRNLVTVIDRPSGSGHEFAGVAAVTRPESCAPLTEAPVEQAFPATAVDGVSTFQNGGVGTSVSLFSYRFADRRDAEHEFDRITAAAQSCNHTQLQVTGPITATLRVVLLPGTIAQTDQTLDVELSSLDDESAFQITAARYKNVISWQYDYRSGIGPSDPDHQLLQALSSRLAATDRVGG